MMNLSAEDRTHIDAETREITQIMGEVINDYRQKHGHELNADHKIQVLRNVQMLFLNMGAQITSLR